MGGGFDGSGDEASDIERGKARIGYSQSYREFSVGEIVLRVTCPGFRAGDEDILPVR